MARAQAAGEDLGLTDDEEQALEDDRPQENENDSDNVSLDYMEGAEVPDKMKPLSRGNKAGEEVIPSNVVYSQPHSVQKLPNELGPGQIDNFERPYMRGTKNVNQPMQQNTYATGKVINYFHNQVLYYCFWKCPLIVAWIMYLKIYFSGSELPFWKCSELSRNTPKYHAVTTCLLSREWLSTIPCWSSFS